MRRLLSLLLLAAAAHGQPSPSKQPEAERTVSSAVLYTYYFTSHALIDAAEAMPEDKWNFAPTEGEFKGARTFAQQIKHVACANFGFFRQIQRLVPPPDCEHGGHNPAKSKAEIMQYLRDSVGLGERVIRETNEKNMLDWVKGRYAGPQTRLGIENAAIWHTADHYGQVVIYLRLNGVVPPASR